MVVCLLRLSYEKSERVGMCCRVVGGVGDGGGGVEGGVSHFCRVPATAAAAAAPVGNRPVIECL